MYDNFMIHLQMLIILCTVGYKRFFYNNHAYFLIIFTSLSMLLSLWIDDSDSYISYFIALYYLFLVIFSYIRLNSLFLSSLYFMIQNSLLILIWGLAYDLPYFVMGKSIIKFSLILYLLEMLLLIALLLVLFFVDNIYELWIEIRNCNKNWTFFAIISIMSNPLLIVYREYLLKIKSTGSYFYISLIFVGLTSSILMITFYINQVHANRAIIKQLKEKSENNTTFMKLANEFQHDYKIFLYTVKRYLEIKDFKGLSRYLNRLENYSTSLLNKNILSQVNIIKDPAIQGLLINCIDQCENKGIKLFLNIEYFSEDIFFHSIDFTRCLSILINNALEHSTEKIYITFSHSEGKNSCTVRNSFNGLLEINNIFDRKFTTKKGHQGIGLTILSRIIRSYDNVNLTVNHKGKWVSFNISAQNK